MSSNSCHYCGKVWIGDSFEDYFHAERCTVRLQTLLLEAVKRTAAEQDSPAITQKESKGSGTPIAPAPAAAPTGGFDRTASHSTGTYQEFDAPTPMEYSREMAHLKIAALQRELAATQARLTNCDEMLQREWREHQETKAESLEQARLLGIFGSREAKLLAGIIELSHCRMEAEHAEVLLKEIDRELESVTYSGSYVEGIKALKADAERYRWWRDHPADYLWTRDLLSWDSVDAAIDAAMKEEPK